MQTNFSKAQLADPHVARSEAILRKCVHCGFCTATCPTYLTLGDELDSPRGRIYLIKDMLENDRPADQQITKHIDRCLSCLSCMTTCPSGVDYMHLVDHARAHIEKTYKRPLFDRFFRAMLAMILPYPKRFGLALKAARLAKPFAPLMRFLPGGARLKAMLALAPARLPKRENPFDMAKAIDQKNKKARVTLLSGCAQSVLDPGINKAAITLLNRLGVEVVEAKGEQCCGALVHHMGREEAALATARANIDAWCKLKDEGGLDAILITTSGCGTTVKDYGSMLAGDPNYAAKAAEISALAKDISEYLVTLDFASLHPRAETKNIRLAYHSACSMQHGQKITEQPKALLKKAGFEVVDIPEGHLCCGSAGTYNIMQPEIAEQLKQRKLANIAITKPDRIAAGNIGCITQLASGTDIPTHHSVVLLNWAFGGEAPGG